MRDIKKRPLVFISIITFIASIIFLLFNIKIPEYGGDELWYAVNLLYKKFSDLNLFEFIYSGPIKTMITYPIFKYFGFSIYSVRLFTIGAYVLTVFLWSLFLYKKRLLNALAASLFIFSLNADLLYFAKVDINQPTFHNLFFALHIILFLLFLKNKKSIVISYSFVLLALIESNLHIRNVWIMNAFLFTFILDFFLFEENLTTLKNKINVLFLKGWPIFIAWTTSALYFLYTIEHFKSNPVLITANHIGGNISMIDCAIRSFRSICNYLVGGRVFAAAFSNKNEAMFTFGSGIIFLLIVIASLFIILKNIDKKNFSNYIRITISIITISVLISVQYSITKSSIHPWHGNQILLLWSIVFGLLIEGLVLINYKKVALIISMSILCIMMTINIYLYQRIHHPDETKTGWAVVFHPHSLEPIRKYIESHPNNYIIADWEIGRPLALENFYSKNKVSIVGMQLGDMSKNILSEIDGKIVIRSTNVTLTVPNWSDDVLAKFNAKFEPIMIFKDPLGREIYQAGYVKKME